MRMLSVRQVAQALVIALPSIAFGDVFHDPIYSVEGGKFKIQGEYVDSTLSGLDLLIVHGQITAYTGLPVPFRSNGQVSRTPCKEKKGGRWECFAERTFSPGDIVTYAAVALNQQGVETVLDTVTFAVGRPSDDYALPVWWHSDSDLKERIDIAAFPDKTVGVRRGYRLRVPFISGRSAPGSDSAPDYSVFEKAVNNIARDLFFHGVKSGNYASFLKDRRGMFNFWVGPIGSEVKQGRYCKLLIPADHREIEVAMDARVVLFRAGCSNAAQHSLRGRARVKIKESNTTHVFAHEAGHVLLGFADEYPGGGSDPANFCPNVFNSLSSCQAANPVPGCSSVKHACKEREYGDGKWRGVNHCKEVMAANDPHQDMSWGTHAEDCMRKLIYNCQMGSCY